jgi:hypothetical protein
MTEFGGNCWCEWDDNRKVPSTCSWFAKLSFTTASEVTERIYIKICFKAAVYHPYFERRYPICIWSSTTSCANAILLDSPLTADTDLEPLLLSQRQPSHCSSKPRRTGTTLGTSTHPSLQLWCNSSWSNPKNSIVDMNEKDSMIGQDRSLNGYLKARISCHISI